MLTNMGPGCRTSDCRGSASASPRLALMMRRILPVLVLRVGNRYQRRPWLVSHHGLVSNPRANVGKSQKIHGKRPGKRNGSNRLQVQRRWRQRLMGKSDLQPNP